MNQREIQRFPADGGVGVDLDRIVKHGSLR